MRKLVIVSRLRHLVLPFCGALLLSSGLSAATITGGTTTVNFDPTTLSTLVGLGFSLAPISPGTLSLTPAPVATFPITGGDTTSLIDHSGGLALTKGGVTADIQNFVINLTTNQLSGQLVAGGSTVNNVPFFNIGPGLTLTVNSTLASDLSSAFGIPNITGATVGTAVVSPTTTPEPSAFALVGAGLLAAFGVLRKRFRTADAN